MKPQNKPGTIILILISLCILFSEGCKLSYDDISLGEFNNKTGEVKGFPQSNYGYIIFDVDDKKIVRGFNTRKEFIPASVTKLFTSLFAVETLGDNYTFSTTLSYTGSISGSTLNGNLYLKGSGDPELSIEGLQLLVRNLKSKSIKELKGNFFYDESLFTPLEQIDKDMPDDAFYNAGISPLSFNSNIIYALQRRNGSGRITSAEMLPSLPAYNAYIYKENLPYPFIKFNYSEGSETWRLPDRYLWDNRQQLPVKKPGLYTAQTFQKLCEINGIKLVSPAAGVMESSCKSISEYNSRPLSSIIKNMLFTSNNITAELIYKASSIQYYSTKHKNSRDINAMEDFFSRNFTGLKWNNFRIFNASGLTDLNRVTPEQTAAVLLYLDKIKKENFRLEEILPLSGWDGTMKNRLDQPGAAFRVFSKTGSIFYASGLAGVFYGRSGKKYLFAIYINDAAKRSEYDQKQEKTADDLNNGGAWTKKASSAIDEFVQKMINEL